MRKSKSIIVNLDNLRPKQEALFLCLYHDCLTSFTSSLPKRKNATEGLICPRCGRDFYIYWKDENEVDIHHGDCYSDMYNSWISTLLRREKRRKK